MKRLILALLGIFVFCGAAAAQDIALMNDDSSDETVIIRNETLAHEEVPTPPVPMEPTGEKHSYMLGFYWTPSERAEYYEVTWKDENGNEETLTLRADDPSCRKETCIVYGGVPAAGSYTWSVNAVNASGSIASGQMEFSVSAAGAALQAYRPNTAISNLNVLTFEWQDTHSGASAFRIQVQDKKSGLLRFDRRYASAELYTGNGVCLINTDLFLPAGDYCWRVTADNGDGSANRSEWVDFSIKCEYCSTEGAFFNGFVNTTVTPSYPVSMITETTPAFEWRALTGASYYALTLTDAAGEQIMQEHLTAADICDPELCRYEPAQNLVPGTEYSWKVTALSAAEANWGSGSASFEIREDEKPGEVLFFIPAENGESLDAVSPKIIWADPGESAAAFEVVITDRNGGLLMQASLSRAQCWCDNITCSIEFDSLPDDADYQISITPVSETGTAGDAAFRTFSKGDLILSVTAPENDSTVQSRPLFRWYPDAGEDALYELILTEAAGTELSFSGLSCGTGGMNCSRGEAFFIPESELPSGTYTLVLRTADGSAQSRAIQFSVQ